MRKYPTIEFLCRERRAREIFKVKFSRKNVKKKKKKMFNIEMPLLYKKANIHRLLG